MTNVIDALINSGASIETITKVMSQLDFGLDGNPTGPKVAATDGVVDRNTPRQPKPKAGVQPKAVTDIPVTEWSWEGDVHSAGSSEASDGAAVLYAADFTDDEDIINILELMDVGQHCHFVQSKTADKFIKMVKRNPFAKVKDPKAKPTEVSFENGAKYIISKGGSFCREVGMTKWRPDKPQYVRGTYWRTIICLA